MFNKLFFGFIFIFTAPIALAGTAWSGANLSSQLFQAAKAKNIDSVCSLIYETDRTAVEPETGNTYLHYLVQNDISLEQLKQIPLTSVGIKLCFFHEISTANKDGLTPGQILFQKINTENDQQKRQEILQIIQYLLEYGASANDIFIEIEDLDWSNQEMTSLKEMLIL